MLKFKNIGCPIDTSQFQLILEATDFIFNKKVKIIFESITTLLKSTPIGHPIFLNFSMSITTF